jgi:ribosome-associated protein
MTREELERQIRRRATFTFARASGPGGQNVNKVSSKAVARLLLSNLSGLDREQRERLKARLGRRVTAGGELLVSVQDTRDQARNRELALERMTELVAAALRRPRKRLRTRPSAGSREARLRAKRRRSQLKRGRGSQPEPE